MSTQYEEFDAEAILRRVAEKLYEARLIPNPSDRQTALYLEVRPQTFANWKSRDSLPWDTLYRLARERNWDFDWLITGRGKSAPDTLEDVYAQIPKHRARLSGGPGAWSFDGAEQVECQLAFRRDWLSGVAPVRSLVALEVEGDSMSPTIEHKNLVLVDTSKNRISDVISGRIYAFSDDVVGGDPLLKVKRLFLEQGRMIVHSDSADAGHRDYTITDLASVAIIGRVVWVGKEL